MYLGGEEWSSRWGLWKNYSSAESLIFSNFVWVGGSVRLILYQFPCGVDWSLYFLRFFLDVPLNSSSILGLSFNKKIITYQKKNAPKSKHVHPKLIAGLHAAINHVDF